MRALHRVLIDQALRDKLKERGYEQAKRFSWDASAQQILRVYHEVSEKRPVRPQLADERIASRAANP
jgi:glycosyltransferase involved in cell wall biosynthesis